MARGIEYENVRSGGPHLNVRRDQPGALPSQRIHDHQRNRTGRTPGPSVYVLFQCVEGRRSYLLRSPSHLIKILLRVLIDHANSRSGGKIVKIIEKNFLPDIVKFGGGV